MKKQPQITEQTRLNLREAFWTLYCQKETAKISVKEITDLAGYNRGTFYLYYKDVYDILDQIEYEILDKIDVMLRQSLPDIAAHDFNSLIKAVMELVQPYARYTMVLLGDKGDPRFVTGLKDVLRPVFLSGLDIYSMSFTPYQKELLVEFWLSGTLAIVMKWIANPQITLEELITFIAPLIFQEKRLISATNHSVTK